MSPQANIANMMSTKNPSNSNWRRFNRYLYKYWKIQAVVISLGLLSVPLGLLNPYLTKLVVDKAYGNRDLKLFFILALIGGTAFILSGLLNFFKGYLSGYINRYVHFDITRDLFKALQRLPLSFFDNRSTGEHIFRVSKDANAISDFICNTIPQLLTLFPRFIFTLLIIFYLNWKLALFAACLVPISYIHPYFFGKWLKETTRRSVLKAQDVFRGLQEVFSHIHLVKALGKERYEIKRFEEGQTSRLNFELKNTRISNIGNFSNSILNKLLSGIIALYGGYLLIKGSMTLGSLAAIMIYVGQLMQHLSSIGGIYQNITVSSVARERLSEILDITPAISDAKGAIAYPVKRGRIEFKDIWFGYKEDSPVLKAMSFLIEPACRIALVGPSGCGKTTILSLILRLYEQEKGAILIDGIDTRKIKLDSLKSQIGIALQEPFLWNDTIANNILYGAEEAADEEVVKSARLAEAYNFIMNFPDKFNSIIGEMACKISEGQKQRIAIARAVIKKPKILILDEAMSSLDSETEDRIIDNIRSELKDSTLIVVSHRLSTVRKMDGVYFLKGPSAIKIGLPEELIEKNPEFRELFASQIQTLAQDKVLAQLK